MSPEILIIGDAEGRADLRERIQKLGYRASLSTTADLERRVAERRAPAAVVACTEDEDPRALMKSLRGTRLGSGVPVALHGPLGGKIGDLADVLDLGADHFLEEPADDALLASVMEELAGPGDSTPAPEAVPEAAPETEAEAAPEAADTSNAADDASSSATEVVLGQLHRTLDKLEARLREREQSDGDADDLDLTELGFAELPSTDDGAPSTSTPRPRSTVAPRPASSIELSLPGAAGSAPSASGSTDRRDPTERLPPSSSSGAAAAALAPAPQERPGPSSPLPIDDQGSIEQMEVPRLLWTLHRAGYTGALELARGRVSKRLWWRDGDLVFARSNVGHDRLVDGLLRRGLLTRDQYDEARRIESEEPGRVGTRLVEAGLLKASELPRVVRNHLIRMIDSTFPWADGQWSLSSQEAAPDTPLGDVAVSLIVAEGVRHRMESNQLLALLGGLDQHPRFAADAPAGGPRALAERLLMSRSEEAWLSRLDGSQPLRGLLALPDADELELLGLTYTLHVLEHLALVGQEGAAEPDVEPGSVDARRIRDRLELAREGDYFVMLGVPRDASRLDVRRAHTQLRQTFASEHLEEQVRAAHTQELQELRDLLDEARDVLSDDSLRSAYLAHLEDV